ncbi:MAG: deoxyribodipyrimidine photo-lyase, partial [Hyphomicrobiales bacterium]
MVEVVWFKRDLRIHDHQPLLEASKKGDIIPLYIIEPELWKQPDVSDRQYHFLIESLSDLNQSLKNIGQELVIKVGNADNIFTKLINQFSIKNIWSHQETWNHWTYQRDLDIKKW